MTWGDSIGELWKVTFGDAILLLLNWLYLSFFRGFNEFLLFELFLSALLFSPMVYSTFSAFFSFFFNFLSFYSVALDNIYKIDIFVFFFLLVSYFVLCPTSSLSGYWLLFFFYFYFYFYFYYYFPFDTVESNETFGLMLLKEFYVWLWSAFGRWNEN